MSDLIGQAPVKSVEMEMVIIRANGSREEIGTVSAMKSNPFAQFFFDHVTKPRTERRIHAANARALAAREN